MHADGGEVATRIRDAVSGYEPSLAWLMEEFDPFLLVQARYRLGRRFERHCSPQDVVQETWVVALPRLSTLHLDEGPPSAILGKFLATTLRNIVSNLMRRLLGRGEAAPLPALGSASGDPMDRFQAMVTGASTRVRRRELHDALRAAVDELDEQDREIVILRGIEQLPNGEVATILGISANAAAVRFHRALKRLKTRLPPSSLEWLPET